MLLPLGWLYSYATKLRISKPSPHIDIPVICIGNITAGGTGKTPTAISIAKLLQEKNFNPYFISRGYGGKLNSTIVDNNLHTATEVGDEPLLLSKQAKVSINPNRFEGAKLAKQDGADILIMDDGFQNPTLYKDLSFLVFDGGTGIGNGRPLPAGPLREDFIKGLKRAQAIIIIGEDKTNLSRCNFGMPIFYGKIQPLKSTNSHSDIIAFAGIGRPEKFYHSLQELDFNIIQTIDFPDHHQYKISELQNIINLAKQKKAEIF